MRLKRLFFGFSLSFFVFQISSAIHYRTISSGNWSDVSIWETANDIDFSTGLVSAVSIPDYNSESIRIRANHSVVIDQSITIDQTVVDYLGSLIYENTPSSIVSIQDGPGVDLLINGTFYDNGPFAINWVNTQARWALGSAGTMVRTRSTSATHWRDYYQGGMSNIPPNSQWILRKIGADHPSITEVNSFYGNLFIENHTYQFWDATVVGSKITGTTSAPVIKGNLIIGENSNEGIKFYTQNNANTLFRVEGNILIKEQSELRLEDATAHSGSSGIELLGDLIVNGIFSYDPTDAADNNRIVRFSGIKEQTISGNGSILLFNLAVNKNVGKLQLAKSIEVNNKLFLTNGTFYLNKFQLTMHLNTPAAIERTNGVIVSEEIDNSSRLRWNIGAETGVFVFPFGDINSNYIPLHIIPTEGDMGYVEIATYSTSSANMPLPVSPVVVTNLELNNLDNSSATVDRFWQLSKTGASGKATITFSYADNERTLTNDLLNGFQYNSLNNQWQNNYCCQSSNTIQNQVTAYDVTDFTIWTLMEWSDPLYFRQPQKKDVIVIENDNDWVLFPHPFNEYISFQKFIETPTRYYLEVYNSTGILVLQKSGYLEKGENTILVDFTNRPYEGLFLFKMFDGLKTGYYKKLRISK